MHHLRTSPSPPATPTSSRLPTRTSPIEFIKKELVTAYSKAKSPGVLAASSSAIALSIGFSCCVPSDAGSSEPGSSEESGWRTAYGAARMAVEIAEVSSANMFLPLAAVVGALTVLVRNYDVSRMSRANQLLMVFTAIHCQCRTDQRNRGKDTVAF